MKLSAPYHELLGDLSDVPAGYIRDVSHMKRFLERWTMDPKYQEAFASDAEAALTALGVSLTPADVLPLIDAGRATEATRLVRSGRAAEVPAAVLRYRAFVQEKIDHRTRLRTDVVPADPRLRAWRDRMINRCIGELGRERAEQIVHAPAAIELSKGCTVGCWFCGVAAPKFEHTWPYTPQNATLWREGQKDIERTRALLRLAGSMDSAVDRFSVIALNSLNRIHDGFTPEELLRVECVPQNKEAAQAGRYLKSNAGRARKFARKRAGELVTEQQSSTIACVSGFLFNMVDKSVKLISPCNASERWPLGYWVIASGTFGSAAELNGYWVIASGTFGSAAELNDLLRSMLDEHIRDALSVLDRVRLRRDVRMMVEPDRLQVISPGLGLAFDGQPMAGELAALLAAGTNTVEQIALRRRSTARVAPVQTLAVLDQLFAQGFFDEEPPAPAVTDGAPELLPLEVAARPGR